MDPMIATFVIMALALVAFVSNRVPLAVVACGVSLALFLTGVLELPEALAGFSDPTPILIASLFIVGDALDATGVTAWAARQVTRLSGTRRRRITVVVSLVVAVITAFISINGAVAALVPLVVVVAVRAGIAPSRLLIPLAFAAHAGSLLTLTGTPVNVIVSDAAAAAGAHPFGFFEFALVGVPLLVLTVATTAAFGGRLLPERHAQAFEGFVDPGAQSSRLRESYRLHTEPVLTPDEGVVEVMLPPRSKYIERHVQPGMTMFGEQLVIVSVRSSAGHDGSGSAEIAGTDARVHHGWVLRAGDALLVQGPWEVLERFAAQADVVAVTAPQSLRRAIPLGRGARRALVILALMVALLVSGIVPAVVAGMLAAGAVVLAGVLPMRDAFRAVHWSTVVLIAGMIPLSTAFVQTGAAQVVADAVLSVVGPASPHLVLLALSVLTIALGQVISNVATVLVMMPISLSTAATLDASPLPFLMSLTVAGAAAFFTPIATPANTMVLEPGGYRFGDYWRLGLPLAVVWTAVAVLYVPLIWPF
ncbi:SLC13 family permease [Microbacterium sp. JZ31]|uniref:SLC13 family permease n=1 Tax=Microbacterium sp. JZ31 TaxID=1906274 RepID=UPI00193305F4|nr:SLC13 family permease [Microbacterium sp. JZ31]